MFNRHLRALKVNCPYCGRLADFVSGDKIWGNRYENLMVYVCSDYPHCDSYVGVHRGTNEPFGVMADRRTRYWRRMAHKAFDPLWQEGFMKRETAYRKLATALELKGQQVHVGMFDIDQCKKTIQFGNDLLELHRKKQSIQLE